ncbi:MAG TPA: hypothetical protein GX699_11465 [Firmicutes bacterium]|nr:hypothetical protein [Bacillota bacterium]
MAGGKFPEDFPAVLQLHPVTGEKIQPVTTIQLLNGAQVRSSNESLPEFVQEKNAQLGITQTHQTMLIEEMGWRLNVTPSGSNGLVISNVSYQDVFFIFSMFIPWLAIGSPCKFDHQYFLNRKITGPFVYVFADGFVVWARYGFGNFSTMDQAFYFLNNGSLYPLMQVTTPAVLDFVPLYIDFDVINVANKVFNYYPFGSGDDFHLAVAEFSRIGGGATPVGQSFNIKIENSMPGLNASARVFFNAGDNPVQYVARWLGFNTLVHPLLNLRGLEIVSQDIVYVYLMQNISTGLFGPRIELIKTIVD